MRVVKLLLLGLVSADIGANEFAITTDTTLLEKTEKGGLLSDEQE